MRHLALAAHVTENTGKGAARKLRQNNQLPAIFYGPATDSIMLTVDYPELTRITNQGKGENIILDLQITSDHGEETRKAMLKELMVDPVNGAYLHADFGASPATVAWLGKQLLGTGFSIRYHSFDIHLNTLAYRDPLRRRKLEDADLVIAVHEDGLGHLKNTAPGAAHDKFEMIRICVVFKPEPGPKKISEPPLVLAAGNLVPAKGFDVLVRAVGELEKRGVDVRLRILGEGPERPRLETLIDEHEIGGRTEMPGYYKHNKLAGHLAGALALVVPARITASGLREGLPTVIAESWLSGTPVIASPIGGIPEVVIDGETGLLFPAEDSDALAGCIKRLVDDKTLRDVLADAGRARADELFSPEKNVQKLVDRIKSRTRYTGAG